MWQVMAGFSPLGTMTTILVVMVWPFLMANPACALMNLYLLFWVSSFTLTWVNQGFALTFPFLEVSLLPVALRQVNSATATSSSVSGESELKVINMMLP